MKKIAGLIGEKVIVTGASGYIGSSLVNALMKQSCEVIRVSRKALKPIKGVRDIVEEISRSNFIYKNFSDADIIYHLAGNTSIQSAENKPINNFTSVLSMTHIYEALLEGNKYPRNVFTSTATVYGLTTDLPVSETIHPMPITVYDEHKLIAEKIIKLYDQSVSNSVILRLANVYGLSLRDSASNDRGILNRITQLALQGQDLVLYGDGNYIRDYVYIDDVIEALLLAGSVPNIGGKTFNIGSEIGTTLREAFEVVTTKVWEIAKVHSEIVSQPWPVGSSAIEFRNFIADTSAFRSLTGWRASTQFESGIMLMVGELYKNKK